MINPQFIHLRVHSAYSLLEGAMKMPALTEKIAKMGFPAVAVTDTATMFGAKAFSAMAVKMSMSSNSKMFPSNIREAILMY